MGLSGIDLKIVKEGFLELGCLYKENLSRMKVLEDEESSRQKSPDVFGKFIKNPKCVGKMLLQPVQDNFIASQTNTEQFEEIPVPVPANSMNKIQIKHTNNTGGPSNLLQA